MLFYLTIFTKRRVKTIGKIKSLFYQLSLQFKSPEICYSHTTLHQNKHTLELTALRTYFLK